MGVECHQQGCFFGQVHTKNALLPSTFKNIVAPVRMCAISSSVGALWFSLIMALFKSLGSRHILSLPFGFLGYVNELTHGVGSICFTMIPDLPFHLVPSQSQLYTQL